MRTRGRSSPRWNGTNPRRRGTNPRELGTNPRAAGRDSASIAAARRYRRAYAIWSNRYSRGVPLCSTCDDTGWSATPAGLVPCASHRRLTASEVETLLLTPVHAGDDWEAF